MKKSFNSRITDYFLKNTRLTVLAFIMLSIMAVGSTLMLKTTGFPNPDINFAIIHTTYIGASSESVVNDITIPVEGAIKEVEGITTYTSESMNSVSFLTITIDETYDTNKVIEDLKSELSKITLPDEADKPEIIIPDIAGPDYQFSLLGEDYHSLFNTYQEIRNDLYDIPQTVRIDSMNPIDQEVLIRLNEQKMQDFGITRANVEQKIKSLGETLPVATQVEIDNGNTSITTTLNGTNISDLKRLPFGDHRLSDFASVSLKYDYKNDTKSIMGFKGETYTALTFTVYATEGTDLKAYNEKLEDALSENEDILFLLDDSDIPDDNEKILLIENYSMNEQNELQVQEVLGGLFGSELNLDSNLKYLGYLLGGIQLVLLVMILFVSFRAAIIAALSIPLSLVFSNIYIFATGENLNTLVLFSLVLVIGLVVDPALVTLESIQRKIDAGFKGKEAAREAIKDVGNGLFLATLTNIIVFFPFALISGILGAIITYIPKTVIPAVIGSYVVPLVFLAWIGSFFLKRSKRTSDSEEENLWGIAKILLSINRWLVTSPIFIRLFILIVAFVFPVVMTGYLFSQGEIKYVQFAGSQNADYLMVTMTAFPDTSDEDREMLTKQVINTIVDYDDVDQVFPFESENSLLIILAPAIERDELSIDIVHDMQKELKDKYGRSFFDLTAGVLSNGPPEGGYQVALSIYSDDLDTLEDASIAIGETIKTACLTDNKITLMDDCSEGNRVVEKVDDGYTDKTNPLIEVKIDRKKLEQKQLIVPDAPLSILVYGALHELFDQELDSVGSIVINGYQTDIKIYEKKDVPKTLNAIKNLEIYNLAGQTIKLKDIAEIKETTAKSSISRVNGKTLSVVQARLDQDHKDSVTSALVSQAVVDYYHASDGMRLKEFGLESDDFGVYTEGDLAAFTKSFQEIGIALFVAIFLTYIVLVVFFESFTQPLVILFTIPMTFMGVFPAIALLGGGEFGFMENIGMIILVGLVENVAIFLIDLAKQKIHEGWEEHEAIAYASAIRLRPVILTTFTAVASLAPLAITSDQYRSMALVIMFGLISSGITSLFTTPILFVFFRWLSRKYRAMKWWNQILFFPLMPFYLIGFKLRD